MKESMDITSFSPADIVWFKSVTNSVVGEAYLNFEENNFVLNFPIKHRTNLLSPNKNEIILIYQKVNGIPSFTHLVSPIDDKETDENKRSEFRYGRMVKIIAKTGKENAIPVSSTLWKNVKLSGVTQGNACKIDNIKNILNLDLIRYDIWQKFKPYFVPNEAHSVEEIVSIINELEISDPNFSVIEGGMKLVSHLTKERNREIIAKKKKIAMQNGSLKCEACTFSFISNYGSHFIECHHLTPISQGDTRETKLDDLALVCSNCHRMLHQKFEGKYLSIHELQDRMDSLKQ